ncbi:MAG: hypothetical protein ABL998_07875 [Planctomycetota bacterium]
MRSLPGARRGASSVLLARSLSLLSLLSAGAFAQGTARVAVSTTDDVPTAAGFPISDGDLVAVEAGQPVTPHFLGGHFQATCGFTPSDIDAFSRLAGPRNGSGESLVFSLLSNEGGFLDGDLIVLARGSGATLLISELDLANAAGMPGENIDVDALAYDDQGRILFSLTTDHVSATLGALSDGDILRLETGLGGVTRILDEAEVQTRFTQATGLSDAILDVQALEWAGGELWCCVQSPSRHDGSVIRLNGAPGVVFDENAMGLGGAEVDALGPIRPGDELPCFRMDPSEALPGDSLQVEVYGEPGALLMVLMGGNSGYLDFSRFAGFGGWYLAPSDPWLTAQLAARTVPYVVLDGSGRYSKTFALPPGTEYGLGLGGEQGWSFQVLDITGRTLSAPFRVKRL